MPYFKWYALDENGLVHKGIDFARSPELVTKIIYKNKCVTLLSCKEYRKRLLFSLSYAERALFFKQMGALLQAGIRVADALAIAEQTVTNKHFKQVIADCSYAVQEGIALSQACSYHIDFFTPFACRLLMAGEESGALTTACKELADYYENVDLFSRKVKAVLLVPAMTVAFFFIIVIAIFWLVIPRFAILLRSLNKPLPWRTEAVIGMSSWLTSIHLVPLLATCVVVCLLLRQIRKRAKRLTFGGAWLMYVPFVRLWIYDSATVSFFKTLGSLLSGGVDISKALSIACLSVSYMPLRTRYESCARAVEGGPPLSSALDKAPLHIAAPCKALLHIGEATGNLGPMLIQCANYYQEKLYKMLDTFSKAVQPLLLLVLGLLVATLVFILYEPIFTLSMMTT
jgi:type II secretory pathway component PulF